MLPLDPLLEQNFYSEKNSIYNLRGNIRETVIFWEMLQKPITNFFQKNTGFQKSGPVRALIF